jgi:hypothetical protein
MRVCSEVNDSPLMVLHCSAANLAGFMTTAAQPVNASTAQAPIMGVQY